MRHHEDRLRAQALYTLRTGAIRSSRGFAIARYNLRPDLFEPFGAVAVVCSAYVPCGAP